MSSVGNLISPLTITSVHEHLGSVTGWTTVAVLPKSHFEECFESLGEQADVSLVSTSIVVAMLVTGISPSRPGRPRNERQLFKCCAAAPCDQVQGTARVVSSPFQAGRENFFRRGGGARTAFALDLVRIILRS